MVIDLKKILAFLVCVFVCLSCVSCTKDKYSDKTVYFSSYDSISTFDPQTASTSAEITVANNCFEGLLTKNKDGEIVNGMAKEYSVSSDKKTYTFVLRDDAVWSDGETPVTAADFEFAFQRAVKKSTGARYVSSLYSIKNAESINKGEMSMSSLGVSADGNTLKITLSKADDGFAETLTRPICFPCNKEFFESTNGKYGLSKSDIISNGAFKVSTYNKDEKTVSLYRNSEYNGEFYAKPQSVSISYSENYEDIYSKFSKNKTDIGTIDCDYISSLKEDGNITSLYYNTNYVLYLSPKLVSSNGTSLRKALVTDIDYSTIKINITDYYKTVSGIIPSINKFEGVAYRENACEINPPEYNPKKAEKALGDYTSASQILKDKSIYYPQGNEKLELIANLIVQGWQKDLDVYINSKAASVDEINAGIKTGEILLAILPVSSENNSAVSSFECLTELKITDKINKYSVEKLYNEEEKLISSGTIYPLISIPTAISCSKDIDNFSASSDGKIIDFRYINKD